MNYAPRVSVSYADISNVILEWSKVCDQFIVYEHDADEEVATTHCHFLMMSSTVKEEALKRRFYKLYPTDRLGNDLWAWKHKEHPNPDLGYIKYMSKGVLAPKFVKNISPAIVDEFRQKWVPKNPVSSVANKSDKPKDKSKEFYSICERVIEIARETPGVYENRLVESEFGSNSLMMKSVIVNPGKVYDILLKELKKNRIMTEINQLTRFMTTILREDANMGEEIKKTVFKRLFPQQ